MQFHVDAILASYFLFPLKTGCYFLQNSTEMLTRYESYPNALENQTAFAWNTGLSCILNYCTISLG